MRAAMAAPGTSAALRQSHQLAGGHFLHLRGRVLHLVLVLPLAKGRLGNPPMCDLCSQTCAMSY
jgi:hypothetical protein